MVMLHVVESPEGVARHTTILVWLALGIKNLADQRFIDGIRALYCPGLRKQADFQE